MLSRPTAVILAFFLFLSILVPCFAQKTLQHDSPARPAAANQASAQAPQNTDADADSDSADIPPFARDRISETEYFALRDQEIRIRRGLDDLERHPHARSQAIRRMEFQEQFLRRVPQGLTPLSALIAAPVTPVWTPLGPAPIPNGQTSPAEVAVSGRVTAIAVDPTNENFVYVGTAQGGLYRSLDGGGSWTPLLDSAQSLAIGAIAIDPQNHDTLFVGTGEGNLSGDSFFGVGIYIIRNASTVSPTVTGPFNSNGATDVFTGRAITRIIVNPSDSNKILVSTASGISGLSAESFNALPQRGVFLSTNALSVNPTFTREPVQTAAGAGQDRTITDMVMDPNNPNKILVYVFGTATAGDGGLWMSTAGDPWAATATWTQNATITRQGFGKFAAVSVGSPGVTTFMLAQDETVACGATATSGGTVKTSADGVTWTAVPAANAFCGGQCFYDMVPAFHPDSAATIFIGGSSNNSTGTCSSRILQRSTNSGASFSPSDALLHADSHAIAFAPGNHNVVYFGNDGGIFKSVNAGVTWSSVNTTGFNATQFVGLSLHPVDPNFAIGGTQDNGTELMKPDGTWTRADFGDGGYSAIDQGSTDTTNVTMYHTYFNSRNSQILVARVTNVASATEGAWSLFGCPVVPGQITGNGITCTDFVLFYAPIALGPGSPNTLYFGTDHLYRSPDRGATMTAVSQPNFGTDASGNNLRVSAIGVGPTNDNVRLIGLTNGKAFATTTGANPLIDVTGAWSATPRFVARAVIDPTNANTAYITLDGYGIPAHVWKTTNLAGGSGTWAAASTGLPDVPVNAFAVDPLNSSYLYAGTDIGVFNSIDGGATWSSYGTGLPRVAVFDLSVHKVSHKVRIATHGRGAWEIAAAANFANTLGLSANPPSPALNATVTFTATINKGTGVPVPTGTVTFSEGVTSLGSGNVNGSGVATLAISTLPAGIHQITATYSGDTLYAGSTSGTVQINVGGAATTLGLIAAPGNPIVGGPVTLTATINTGGNLTAPTGTVSFIENANVLGTSALAGSTVATFQTSTLTVGPHSITASYSGDAVYSSSNSVAVTVTVVNPTPPDYSVNIPNGSATITAGQSANYTISITPQGGFAGTVNFACTGLPAASSCGFNPSTLTPNGSPASTTLTIGTTARSVASARPFSGNTLAAVLSFGLIGIVFLSRSRRKRGVWVLLGAMLTALAIVSCGGGGPPPPPPVTGTPAGTFSVTVTATSGATIHSSTITLTVQ
jgi:hypothetical protein